MYKKVFHRVSFFLLLFSLCAIVLEGCGNFKENSPRNVVKKELNQLKDINEETIRTFFSYNLLSDGDTSSEEIDQNTVDAVQLFFKHFSYKIQDTKTEQNHAVVTVSITNIDTGSLANDLCRAIISDSFDHTNDTEESSTVFYSSLLREILMKNEYDLITTTLEIPLEKIDDVWTITTSNELENGLMSGLISYLQDPNTVSAEEVVDLNLSYFKNLTPEELISYLGICDIFSTSSSIAGEIDLEFTTKLSESFQYKIVSSQIVDASATVTVEITTLNLSSVLTSYRHSLLAYAETADAILSTESERSEKTARLLLNALTLSSDVTTSTLEIHLKNTGLVWEIKNMTALTEALLGNITEASKAFSEASSETEAFSSNPESDAETQSETKSETEPETEILPLIQPAA